jgi:hypothetical protein
MSTLANITSLNLSLQTGGAALAIKAVKSVAKPARTVYVFGTADDVAPNFTTEANAITYAQSLTPVSTKPVIIRTFTKADGTPYTLAGLSSWTTYANQYIYFVSDFVRLNETTTLPTTLPAGLQVWYIDPNGVETLWVGREDASAWPAVGYKEYVALLTQTGTSAPVATVLSNTIGAIVWAYAGVGQYTATLIGAFPATKTQLEVTPGTYLSDGADTYNYSLYRTSDNMIVLQSYENGSSINGAFKDSSDSQAASGIRIRVYP